MERALKSWLISQLRRASQKWPPASAARKAARVGQRYNPRTGRVSWHSRCAHCKQIFPERETQLDHIVPIANIDGFTSWNSYIEKMFVGPSGYQVLCSEDHKKKTAEERAQRSAKKALEKGEPCKKQKKKR